MGGLDKANAGPPTGPDNYTPTTRRQKAARSMGIWYTTRESVKDTLDAKATAVQDARIARAIDHASRTVEDLTHRTFYPWTGTRYFDWPNPDARRAGRLWLGPDELVSATTVVSGSDTLTSSEYFLEPVNQGPPYTHLDVNLGTQSAFTVGATSQHAIAITGVFGYRNDEDTAGALVGSINSSTTSLVVSDSSLTGVGSLLRIGTERIVVTEKSWATSAQTQQADMTAAASSVSLAVTTGSAFNKGERVLLGSEIMLITAVSGNTLTVKRAQDGTVLAAHSGATIYLERTYTVARGQVGTTAASRTDGVAVYVHTPPAPIVELTTALACDALLQGSSGWSRTRGGGDSAQPQTGGGLAGLWDTVEVGYRRWRDGAV